MTWEDLFGIATGLKTYADIGINDDKEEDKEEEMKDIFQHMTCWKLVTTFNPYPTAFPYGNGMVLHFYQQQESSTTKTVHKVINKGLKAYV